MFNKIEKSENHYWVSESKTSKIGFVSAIDAIEYAYPKTYFATLWVSGMVAVYGVVALIAVVSMSVLNAIL